MYIEVTFEGWSLRFESESAYCLYHIKRERFNIRDLHLRRRRITNLKQGIFKCSTRLILFRWRSATDCWNICIGFPTKYHTALVTTRATKVCTKDTLMHTIHTIARYQDHWYDTDYSAICSAHLGELFCRLSVDFPLIGVATKWRCTNFFRVKILTSKSHT